MAEVIKGDVMSHEDVTFTVESHDDGIALLIVDIPGLPLAPAPVELTRDKTLRLIRQLLEAVQED